MRLLLRIALLLSFVLPLFAQTTAATAFPLTNTRYGAFRGPHRLVTDGRDFFLFWQSGTSVRMTKLVDGEARAGRPVMPVVDELEWAFDVVWTGRYFLVVASDYRGGRGRVVTAAGEPVGEVFEIPVPAYSKQPQLAFNGTDVLLVQGAQHLLGKSVVATRLTPEGRVLGTQTILARPASTVAVASNGDGFAVLAAAYPEDRLLTLDRTGAVRSEQSLGGTSTSFRLASDGRGYRAVGVADDGRTWSFGFDANGTLGETIALEDATAVSSLVWTGAAYQAAFVTETDYKARLVEIGPGSEPVTTTEPAGPARGSDLQLAAAGGRVMSAWTSFDEPSVMVSPLPLTGNGTPAAYAAAEQTLREVVSNADGATMVLWSEVLNGKETHHLGVRSREGLWHEQQVPSLERALAATDGRDFAVLFFDGGLRLRRFDPNGRPSGPAVTVDRTLEPEHLIWNGTTFVVVGFRANGDLVAAFLSSGGVMSAPVVVRPYSATSYQWMSRPVLATNGSSYFVAWLFRIDHHFPPFGSSFYLVGARLAADLSVVGGSSGLADNVEDGTPGLTWDGRDYVVAWVDGYGPRARKVAPTGTLGPEITQYWDGEARGSIDVEPAPAGAALVWRTFDYTYHAAILGRGESSVSWNTSALETYAGGTPRVANLSGGRVALVLSAPHDAPPYHGSHRIQMQLLQREQSLATAPAATVRLVDGRLVVEWAAMKEPVTGYRVEYRIGDGNWNELERSPDPAVRTASMKPPRPGTAYAFRVRGINDDGPGPYSAPATIYLGKRRAVR